MLTVPRALTVLVVAFACLSSLHAAEPLKPNIVYILADDLGYGDLGCYNPASKIPTPNMDRLAKEGVRFTDAHFEKTAKGGKPFFLYLPLTSPHYPVVPSAAFKGKSKAGEYGDFVVQTDHVVGEILDALKRSGVAENTLVICTSDNGPEVSGEVKTGVYDRLQEFGHASMGTLRGAKRDAWEGGHRVPFIARWPGKIRAASTCDETVCHVDLMATLAAMFDAKLPADAGVDSVNILPALLGEKRNAPLREATVHHSGQGKFAIRCGDWVLILAPTGDDNRKQGEPPWFQKDRGYKPHTDAGELFNLATDPTQVQNLYATETAKVHELTTLMERYVTEGRSTPGPKQKNDVEVTWDKRAGK